jgi:hypothetical protein
VCGQYPNVGAEALARVVVKGSQQVRLCRTEAVIESRQELGSLSGDDDAAGAPIGRIGAAFDQAGDLEVIEEVRHDRAVDSEVLRQGELTAHGAVCGSGEHLIAAGTAGQVGDCGEGRGHVGPKDRPESPSQVVRQCVATAADRLCCFAVLSDIGHDASVPVIGRKVSYQDVL